MSRAPRKTYKKEDVLKILLAESFDDDLDASDNDDWLPPSETSDAEEDNIEEVEHSDCQTDVERESEDERGRASTGGTNESGRSLTRRGRGHGRRRGDVTDERVTPNVRQFVAKSGHVWTASPVRIQQCKRAPKNIVHFEGRVKGATKNVASLLDSFRLFIDDKILEVVQETNNEGRQTFDEWNSKHPDQLKTFRPTDHQEMLAYIGLLLLRCVYRSPVDNRCTTCFQSNDVAESLSVANAHLSL